MTIRHALPALLLLVPGIGAAQSAGGGGISVQPAKVSVSSQGVTTVILTYSGLIINTPAGPSTLAPADAFWCGRLLVSALGPEMRCDPATIYGQAPAAVGTVSAGGVFTDVMSVPASVAQRAYEAALAGQPSGFFYVRHFVSSSAIGTISRYVDVTCLLGAGGASAPFTLTNVRLRLPSQVPVLFVTRGDRPPQLFAEIAYTGTGRLQGSWQVVLPGEDRPSPHDLLTEGSLPLVERGLQRRYTELERFNVLLLPTGRFTLPGPDPARLPTSVDGSYTIVLHIEASDDPLSDTRLAGVVIHNGAAAGFPMPTMRYIVGGSRTRSAPSMRSVRLRFPLADAFVSPDSALTLSWVDDRSARRYRVEIERIADGKNVLSAIVAQGVGRYDVPPFVLAQVPGGKVRWRVVALDAGGSEVGRSEWRGAQRQPPA
jgi:hypothetical protein